MRTRYLREVEPLMALGADEVIADELEVSIEVFSRVLARMLVPREDIKALIGDVRGDWRRMTRGLAKEATAVHDLRVAVPNLVTHSLRLHALPYGLYNAMLEIRNDLIDRPDTQDAMAARLAPVLARAIAACREGVPCPVS